MIDKSDTSVSDNSPTCRRWRGGGFSDQRGAFAPLYRHIVPAELALAEGRAPARIGAYKLPAIDARQRGGPPPAKKRGGGLR